MTTDDAPAPYGTQRQAAARNRVSILEAAHGLLTESPAASMNEIAKRAGVGAGTLYRHFPSREDLILAVYRRDVGELVDLVEEVLARYPPLEAAVGRLLAACVADGSVRAGLDQGRRLSRIVLDGIRNRPSRTHLAST